MNKEFEYLGKSYPIHDAITKVTGTLVYVGDMKLSNMHYAKLLLSPIAHGIIKKIDTTRAEQVPGVVNIFSYLNSPDTLYNCYKIIPTQEDCPEDQVLFPQKVRYVGDRVAAVVATTAKAAKKAVSLIDVEYEELPVISDMEDALKKDSIQIHSHGNLINHCSYEIDEETDVSDVKERILFESITLTSKMHHAAMETHCCSAAWDGSGKITIWTPCQSVFGVRTVVADFLGVNYNMVRVIKTPTGGSFGCKQEAFLEPLAAFLSKETKAPVMLKYNREESIISTMTRPAAKTKISTISSQEGKLLECSINTLLDGGAYITNSVAYINGTMGKITKLYRIPKVNYEGKSVHTNTPITGGFRGWGSPEFFTAVEIHMDQLAKKLKIDPITFRLKNLVHPFDIDKVTKLPLGNARVIDCLEKGAIEFGWFQKFKSYEQTGRFRRGIGLACAAHKTGMFGRFPDFSTMTLKMNEDGTFVLNTALHDLGCGMITSIKLIVAEVLDIDPDLICVLEADSERSPYDFGTYGSRGTFICGSCAEKAARKIREQILDVASIKLQLPKGLLEIKNGSISAKDDKSQSIRFKEIGTISKLNYHQDIVVTETHYGTSNPGAYGAHFAEVEVDTETGRVRVTDYLAVQDVGLAITREMIEGQIHGAVQMGIGYALYEEIKINSQGQILNSSFKNYHVVNAPDMPKVRIMLIEEGEENGPFGAKGVGEVATVPVAAAIVNAVNNALNTNLTNVPLTPEVIISALQGQKQPKLAARH